MASRRLGQTTVDDHSLRYEEVSRRYRSWPCIRGAASIPVGGGRVPSLRGYEELACLSASLNARRELGEEQGRVSSSMRDLLPSYGEFAAGAGAIASVANQQSDARQKQLRGVRRRPHAVRLAHHPGHAVVRPPATRRISAWRSASWRRRRRSAGSSPNASSDCSRSTSERNGAEARFQTRAPALLRPYVAQCCCACPSGVSFPESGQHRCSLRRMRPPTRRRSAPGCTAIARRRVGVGVRCDFDGRPRLRLRT